MQTGSIGKVGVYANPLLSKEGMSAKRTGWLVMPRSHLTDAA